MWGPAGDPGDRGVQKRSLGAEASRPYPSWTARYLLRCPDVETEALSQKHTRGEAESAARGGGKTKGESRTDRERDEYTHRDRDWVESWVSPSRCGAQGWPGEIEKRGEWGEKGGQVGEGAGESPREEEKEGGTSQSCKTWLPCLRSRAWGRRPGGRQWRPRRPKRRRRKRASSCKLCRRPRVSNWFKNRRQRDRTGASGGAPCKSESDGNPTTEDESSRSPEDLERGAAPVSAEAAAQSSIFLAGASPPAPCPASSSILVNGSFLAASSSPAVLLNGGPVIINGLALGEASSLGPLLLTGGGGAPPPQPSPQGASEAKTSLVLDPQTGEVRLEEAQPEAPETKGAQVAASGPAPGEEVPGPLPQVVPGPLPAATFPLPPGPVPAVAAPQVVPLSPPSGYPTGLSPTSPLLNLPQVVPTSQVVTLPQAVGPLQLLAAGPGSPVKVAAAAGPANVHLINSGVGVTALQLPSATAPGNFLLANPVSGSPIVTGVAVQQGKIILTATFPTSMLVSQVLPPGPGLALPLKPETAISVPEGGLPVAPSPALSEAHALGTLSTQQPPPTATTSGASLPFSPDSPSLLPSFPAAPPEGLMLSPAAVPVWPAALELSAGTEGLLETEKGLGTQAPHTVLRLPDPDPEGLLLGATAGGEVDEGLEAEAKVLTQLQSVPVEEPLEL
ncbi:homeobox protein SIX5 isoform X2 [Cebus imitator]|uniref:homeobox protein SIX5 isoform X2 n=1 Tax=Cebus imitator TaxID=2715852 RepID=UPI00080A2517|nr:homeobox protein SIX5 isoform X2 [Cebus imitator]